MRSRLPSLVLVIKKSNHSTLRRGGAPALPAASLGRLDGGPATKVGTHLGELGTGLEVFSPLHLGVWVVTSHSRDILLAGSELGNLAVRRLY